MHTVVCQAREELAPPDVPRKYEHKEALVGLCRCGGKREEEGGTHFDFAVMHVPPCCTISHLLTPPQAR